VKKVKGIKYNFRPKSYWNDSDPLQAILRNIKGENRRQMVIDYWNAGLLENLDQTLLQDELGEDERRGLGRIHPSFMGGEYLPPYLPGEVEIARICLQSTTSDVISLRARPIPTGIAYRIEDEYEGKFTLPITRSTKPLSLRELIRQFEDGRLQELPGNLATGYNDYNAEWDDRENLRHFTRIESNIYQQLESHFEVLFEEWVLEGREEETEEETEEAGI
jgi:hypothetical protein